MISIHLNSKPTKTSESASAQEIFHSLRNLAGVREVNRAIDTNVQRQPVAKVLADLEDLDAVVLVLVLTVAAEAACPAVLLICDAL